MSLRHMTRSSERERHLEAAAMSHPHPHISHPPPPPHVNGNTNIPSTPGTISNGSAHSHSGAPIVSPTVVSTTAPNGQVATAPSSAVHKLAVANEQTWLLIGRIAEQMGDLEHAQSAYENALRHNPMSLSGLTQVAGIARIKENYPTAVEYFQRVISLQEDNGEVWSALGHCYLMQDDLQKAYSAYQQALYLLPNPKEDPKLWYGIGILYDRYGSLDHAEEAFSSVLRMDKDIDKANEILFRLGIIYKQQSKYEDSLACFNRILRNPPSPLAHADIWFQIGHVYEQQKDHVRAKDAYERVVADNPGHAKVLQQLGWLYHQDGSSFQNQDLAIQYLTKSLEADPCDAQSWYLLGRAYMAGQKYNKAYEAYQQAVYRDGRNPTFWCSIGVLYFQINQFRDALDAYSRAIRINPYISEVWFDLGSLYESCNNQISDAIDAYARASELDPTNPVISQRLQLLKTAQATGGALPAAPGPQDVHPTAYASAVVPPPGLTGPPLLLQGFNNRPPGFRAESRGAVDGISLPPPSQVGARSSPGPFRGGPPPPVIIDESRQVPSHPQLAPMDVDRPPIHPRDYPPPPPRDSAGRGPVGHQSLLLHHPVPQQQVPTDDLRNGGHGHHQDPFFTRPPLRVPSQSPSPHPSRARSPLPFQSYPPPAGARQPSGPGQPNTAPSQRSPRQYAPHEPSSRRGPPEQEAAGWDRRGPPPAEYSREWGERSGRSSRHGGDYPPPMPPPQPAPSNFRARSPGPPPHHLHSPERSPRLAHPSRAHWESKPLTGPSAPPQPQMPPTHMRTSPPQHHHQPMGMRYDPRHDGREHQQQPPREHEREVVVPPSEQQQQRHEARGSYAGSPPVPRQHHAAPYPGSGMRPGSESPRPTPVPESRERRRRVKEKEREPEMPAMSGPPPGPVLEQMPKKEKKRRSGTKRVKDEQRAESPRPFMSTQPGSSGKHLLYKGMDTPESVNGSGSSARSAQPSPTGAIPGPPSRLVDEDYDEGVADALMGLARGGAPSAQGGSSVARSPPVSAGSRGSRPSPPHASMAHRGSISSTRSHASPPPLAGPDTLKRPLSPASDGSAEAKRARMDGLKRRGSSPATGGRTPAAGRHSPMSYRGQPSRSPEERPSLESLPPYHAPSPPLAVVLPPHPRPIGAGLSSHSSSSSVGGGGGNPIALPPIATLSSPTSTAPSPPAHDRMDSRSVSPPSRGGGAKLSDVVHPSRSPPTVKGTPSPRSSVHAMETEQDS